MNDRSHAPHGGLGFSSHGETSLDDPNSASVESAKDKLLQQSTTKPRQAARACDVCRQMKVKCDEFDNPPCVRCRKSGRECLFRFSAQPRDTNGTPRKRAKISTTRGNTEDMRSPGSGSAIQKPSPAGSSLSAQARASDISVRARPAEFDPAGCIPRSEITTYSQRNTLICGLGTPPQIPLIYSKSPLEAVNESGVDELDSSSPQTTTKQTVMQSQNLEQESLWNFTSNANSYSPHYDLNIPRRDLRGMVKIFLDKLLPHIPALSIQDFQDVDQLIETEFPLVCCMCYVTARFLSGGKQLREVLMPQIAQILKGKFSNGQNHAQEMSTMKALIILYAYGNASSPSPRKSDSGLAEEILYWPLKSLVEVYALRLSLHRSLSGLQADLSSQPSSSITKSINYQKYTLWLQLFTMAKYASVLSGTPPSIPIDSTIRAGASVMEEIGMNSQAGLFGEAELATIWEKVDRTGQLGEWWCPRDPREIIDEQKTESVLQEADRLIDNWYDKWASYINDEDGRGARLDYCGRSARFWVKGFATSHLNSSPRGLTNVQKDQVLASVVHASRVLDWPLELSPFQKESIRYVPESYSVMVSYCCLYIVASCQTFGSMIPDLLTSLDKVVAAAHFMLDLSPDTEHNAYIQASMILRRVEALQKHLRDRDIATPRTGRTLESTVPTEDTEIDGFDYNFFDDGLPTSDIIWDFPMMLTPRMW